MLASAVAVGLFAGVALGGRLDRLRRFSVRWPALLVAAVGLRLLAPVAGELATAAYVLGFAGIAAAALRNVRLPGMVLIAAGAGLNLLVVAANGAMPVGADALSAAAATMPGDRLHMTLTGASRLELLADVIPLAPVRAVYSVGDVLLAVGGAIVSFRSVRA